MSPPDTNIEKQTRRHKGSLGGITLAIILMVLAVGVWFLVSSPEETTGPQDTGEVSSATQ